MCHTVLVRVARRILHSHFGPLTVLRHRLRILVALITQQEHARFLRHAEARVLGAGDRACRNELVAFAGDLLVRHVLLVAQVLGLADLAVAH